MRLILFIFLIMFSVPAAAQAPQTLYDRVIESGTIRCGYTLYSIGLNKDLNTGELWGIYKDIVEEIGKKLNLEIEWVEEVGWGQQIEGLNAGRYDMMCSPTTITGPRAKAADFSHSLYYSPVWIWVATDNDRFDSKPRSALNNTEVTLSTMDGEQTDAIADDHFPKAKKVSLPQSSEFSSLMLNVTSGKADATFAEPLKVYEYMENNPNSLRNIKGDKPLSVAPNVILMKRDEFAFKSMINNTLTELFLSGVIDDAIDRYETYPDSYIRSKGMY